MSEFNKEQPDVALMSASDRIDVLCDSFELELVQGRKPQIEHYLEGAESAYLTTLLVELVQIESEHRRRSGEHPSVDDYAARFPQHSSVLKAIELESRADSRPKRQAAVPKLGPRFELHEPLGAGGFGTVWRARDTQLERTVAVKLPHAAQLSPAEMDAFLREAKAAAQLRHPNIIAVHEFGFVDEVAYIVYDYVAGLNLSEWSRAHILSPEATATLGARLARALHHAHQRGVVHRDLKPANIVLDEVGEPHITDFGLAKRAASSAGLPAEGSFIGTPAYMAPEQLRGAESEIEARTDIYALGTILYELLTGVRPLQGAPGTVIHQVLARNPYSSMPDRKTIPRDLESICAKATSSAVTDRYETAEEMALDLERFVRGEPVRVRPRTLLARGWRWSKRNRRLVVIQALLVCLTLGALGFALGPAKAHDPNLKTVLLETNPPGATVVFVPIDAKTGEFRPNEMIHANGNSPVATDLLPGDYLVVASLDENRFHEVFRHVPQDPSNLPGAYRHLRWKSDDKGRVLLPSIEIPSLSVTERMAFIEGSGDFKVGSEDSTVVPAYHTSVPSFLIDPYEFTVGEYKKLTHGHLPTDLRYIRRPDDHALTINFDAATAAAEHVGKRLPDEVEFEFAATRRRIKSPPGGAGPIDLEQLEGFGPVGTPDNDCLDTTPPVYGLLSNVAEWTDSPNRLYPKFRHLGPTLDRTPTDFREVRGGDSTVINGSPSLSPEHRNPLARIGISRASVKPGVGFRCVRSAKARLSPEFFIRTLDH